ncbi:MAG TPA: hypothetical protein VM012_03650, partial [Flavitalea sp.]|nr:hypothetical protein [Flavitalea sp.]
NGQLKKLSSTGDSLAVFNEVRRYGKVHSIDVSNPLKVLLYYKDFGTIVTLDRYLNIRNTIDLRRLGMFQVKMIAQSYDNNIWIFDELDSRLKRIGDDGRLIDQFNDFRMLFDSVPSPAFLIDQNKFLYLYDPSKGVYTFDYYGTFKSRVPFTSWIDFTVISNTIYGRDEKNLYSYEPGSLNLIHYPLPPSMAGAMRISIMPNFLYVLRENGLQVYGYR